MSKNSITKILSFLFTFILLFNVFGNILFVSADEISSEAKSVVEMIDKLPLDPKTVTKENKDAIVAAKTAYNSLTPEQKIEIPTEKLTILNGDYTAVLPIMMAELTVELKKLPTRDKVSEKDKDKILALYEDFSILDETTREAFSNEYIENLLGAVYKLAPDELTEEDAEKISKIEETKKIEAEEKAKKEAEKKAKQKQLISNILKYSLVIFLAIMVLFAFIVMLIMIVKFIKLSR